MKKFFLFILSMFLATIHCFAQNTPLSMNGRLKLVGNQLSNECGSGVQLRGMSTHGVMFHTNCYTPASVKSLAEDWKSDLVRLAIYTASSGGTPGYIDGNRQQWNTWIDNMVNLTEEQGMYVIIDWHILSDGNPMTYINEAKAFFQLMSERYKDKRHVLYEICNEPNGGVSWGTIKSYAEQVIPVIRANDPEGIILVGTPDWSSKVWDAANNPLTGANAHNVMYAFHFYAGSHFDYAYLRSALGRIPVFATEWGTVDASGNGGFNPGSADTWLSILDGNNAGGQLVSSANWAFVDKNESASALAPNSCTLENWTNRTQAGNYIYNYISKPDNFQQCNSAADDDGDGVPNGRDLCPNTPQGTYVDNRGCPALQGDADNDGIIDARDLCPNTPEGTPVNMNGCPILDDFVSNVCNGFNNYQGYARTDFSEDSLANVNYWNRPDVNNPVYSAGTQNGELVIQVTNADPTYATMGFSFGEVYTFNGTKYDTTLLPLDISRHPVVEMKVHFAGTNYSSSTVLLDIQLEDVNGNVVNANSGVVMRKTLSLNKWENVVADFSMGSKESYDAGECAAKGFSTTPCYITTDFDFTKVNKVKMNVNPGAGESWSRPPFSGVWKMDDFSVGYDALNAQTCTAIRDDDGDGIKEEKDRCPNTPPGATVDANGCASFQRDDDGDGVANPDDLCPNTPPGAVVNSRGCAANEGDDDGDGVMNIEDRCPNTPQGVSVDAYGCSEAQLNADDDEDGVLNGDDLCPNTPAGESVDSDGCAYSQLDDDNDGVSNGEDGCPNDPAKTKPGNCGCGIAESDCSVDCAGQINGDAYMDNCDQCVGGTTGKTACTGQPYNGAPITIPGILQAEHFDLGGQGVGYNDTEAENQGGAFRQNEGVDIELAENIQGTYNIAYTATGEWLNYTVHVQQTGTYIIRFRMASNAGRGGWQLFLNSQPLEGTRLSATSTGGWQTYGVAEATQPVYLPKGDHVLRLVINEGDFNLDYIEFIADRVTGLRSATGSSVSVFPIPAANMLTINQVTFDYDKAVITDLTGKVLKSSTLSSASEQLSVEELEAGVYLLQLNGAKGSELLRIIVK